MISIDISSPPPSSDLWWVESALLLLLPIREMAGTEQLDWADWGRSSSLGRQSASLDVLQHFETLR